MEDFSSRALSFFFGNGNGVPIFKKFILSDRLSFFKASITYELAIPDDIIPVGYKKDNSYLVGTSGSSGRPVTMYKDMEYITIEALAGIRQLRAYGMNWRKIKNALRAVGAPTTSKELGIADEYLIEALHIAHTIRPERYTILGDKGISREAAEEALRVTGIIK